MDTASESAVSLRYNSKSIKRWRPSSLINIVTKNNNKHESVLQSIDADKEQFERKIKRSKSLNNSWSTVVSVVLIEAKNITYLLDDGMSKGLYCKLRLGMESFKSKNSSNEEHPEWRESFKMHLFHDNILHISLWDRGKQRNSIGSCVVDLAKYQKERTHDIWLEVGEGPGKVHLSITMCAVRSAVRTDECLCNFNKYREKYKISNMDTNLSEVGILHVKVIGARGLGSKPSAYCTLQVDNQKVQTHRAGTAEIVWNRCYTFNVYDVTSTLDLKVYESSIANSLLNESIGKVSIPLLRIANDEKRWYALKDRNKRNSARGNFPRVLLQMSVIYHPAFAGSYETSSCTVPKSGSHGEEPARNSMDTLFNNGLAYKELKPVKASIKLFQPKEEKHVKKGIKFDIALLYSNVVFVSNVFCALQDLNEFYKRVFEWDDREFSFFVLMGWIMFCYFIQIWMIPLILLLPFMWHFLWNRHQGNVAAVREHLAHDDDIDMNNNNIKDESDKGLISRLKIQELQQVTITVTRGIEMIASYAERLYNLVSFKVPFISYVTMILLTGASIGLYVIPINYLLMGFGIMKFTRKYINPNRVLNNDLLDFLSRIPDDAILKDWKELHVPKPNEENTKYLARSVSTSV